MDAIDVLVHGVLGGTSLLTFACIISRYVRDRRSSRARYAEIAEHVHKIRTEVSRFESADTFSGMADSGSQSGPAQISEGS